MNTTDTANFAKPAEIHAREVKIFLTVDELIDMRIALQDASGYQRNLWDAGMISTDTCDAKKARYDALEARVKELLDTARGL